MSGDAQVEAYNCGGGAAYYIAKMFPYEDTKYEMGGLEHFARSPLQSEVAGRILTVGQKSKTEIGSEGSFRAPRALL
jgi:hypothetical protein